MAKKKEEKPEASSSANANGNDNTIIVDRTQYMETRDQVSFPLLLSPFFLHRQIFIKGAKIVARCGIFPTSDHKAHKHLHHSYQLLRSRFHIIF